MSRPSLWMVGGSDVWRRAPLARRLGQAGFAVTLVGTSDARRRSEGVTFVDYTLSEDVAPLGDIRAMLSLRRVVRRHRPRIVHAFDTKPGILVPVALAGLPGVQVVRTVTGLGRLFSAGDLGSRALRVAYQAGQHLAGRLSSLTVFQNPDDQEFFCSGQFGDPSRYRLILGSGIDTDRFCGSVSMGSVLMRKRLALVGEADMVITMVARLLPQKGVAEFIEAGRAIRDRYPNARFLLVGPATEEEQVRLDLLELHQTPVTWLGERRDIPDLLALSDVFVLPSYYREGVPRSLLEAGALGLPLITTDTPGCREVVQDRYNGRLVPPRDAGALAHAIIEVLSLSREKRAEMGRRARAKVIQDFSLERVADQYARLYRELLS